MAAVSGEIATESGSGGVVLHTRAVVLLLRGAGVPRVKSVVTLPLYAQPLSLRSAATVLLSAPVKPHAVVHAVPLAFALPYATRSTTFVSGHATAPIDAVVRARITLPSVADIV